jgi:hypothetical protein
MLNVHSVSDGDSFPASWSANFDVTGEIVPVEEWVGGAIRHDPWTMEWRRRLTVFVSNALAQKLAYGAIDRL